jgi:hypothetical protein
MVSTGGPKSIGPGARWGCPGGLGWFRAGGDTHKVGTQSGSDRQSWSTIGTRGVLCTIWAHGLQRFLHSLLSVRNRGLGRLRGLATHRGVGAGEALGAGSLILISLEDFPMAFLVFFWGVRLAASFRLPV